MKPKQLHFSRNAFSIPYKDKTLLERFDTDFKLNRVMHQNRLDTIDIRAQILVKGISFSLKSYNKATKPNLSLYRQYKEENDEMTLHLTQMKKIKEYNQKRTYCPITISTTYGLNDLINQYRDKNFQVPKLSINNNNLFKVEPLLEDHQKRIDENMVLYPNAVNKAIGYLRKLKKAVNQALYNGKRKAKGESVKNASKTTISFKHLRIMTEEDQNENDQGDNFKILTEINTLLKMIHEEKLGFYCKKDSEAKIKSQSCFFNKNVRNFLRKSSKLSTNKNEKLVMRSNTSKYTHMPSKIIEYKQQSQITNNLSRFSPIPSPMTTNNTSKKNTSISLFIKKKSSVSINNEIPQSLISTFSIDAKPHCNNDRIEETPKNKSLFNLISNVDTNININKRQSSPVSNSVIQIESNSLALAYHHLLQNNLIATKDIIKSYFHTNHLEPQSTQMSKIVTSAKEANPRALYNQISALQNKVKDKNIPEKVKKIYSDNHKLNQITTKIVKLANTEREISKLNNVLMQNIMSNKLINK